jgi:hypothetical protein
MRIESVTAHAFGPFLDAVLNLTPDLNVLYGPNESGKSNWHAAIYAALCGMRRGRGTMRIEDQKFKERHQPWSGTSWRVSARIRLEDGQTIEMSQDLAGLVDCRAWDVVLGRDVSSEIIFDGTPDASRWLGLDRHAFLATACVRQAELLVSVGVAIRSAAMTIEHFTRYVVGGQGAVRGDGARKWLEDQRRVAIAEVTLLVSTVAMIGDSCCRA